jgi:hypothetical protein
MQRKASATWRGGLKKDGGNISAGNGALKEACWF